MHAGDELVGPAAAEVVVRASDGPPPGVGKTLTAEDVGAEPPRIAAVFVALVLDGELAPRVPEVGPAEVTPAIVVRAHVDLGFGKPSPQQEEA